LIIKPRVKHPYLCQLEALDLRVPDHLPQKQEIVAQLNKETAGYKGELAVEYPLSFLPHNDFHIIHGIRLKGSTYHFQIDTLLLARSLIIPLEIKNFTGKIKFEDNGQFTRTGANGKQEGYLNPLVQANYQSHQLRLWLLKRGYPDIPILPLVIIAFPSTIIEFNPLNAEVNEKVHHSGKIPIVVTNLQNTYPTEKLNTSQLHSLSKLITSSHQPNFPDVKKKFQITREDYRNGVRCSNCGRFHMIRDRRTWKCPPCGYTSPKAHLPALLNDYPLLIGNTITNRQARDFLQVNSDTVIKKLLQNSLPSYSGGNKSRTYNVIWQGPYNF
jgi:Nuclease-related domain